MILGEGENMVVIYKNTSNIRCVAYSHMPCQISKVISDLDEGFGESFPNLCLTYAATFAAFQQY